MNDIPTVVINQPTPSNNYNHDDQGSTCGRADLICETNDDSEFYRKRHLNRFHCLPCVPFHMLIGQSGQTNFQYEINTTCAFGACLIGRNHLVVLKSDDGQKVGSIRRRLKIFGDQYDLYNDHEELVLKITKSSFSENYFVFKYSERIGHFDRQTLQFPPNMPETETALIFATFVFISEPDHKKWSTWWSTS